MLDGLGKVKAKTLAFVGWFTATGHLVLILQLADKY